MTGFASRRWSTWALPAGAVAFALLAAACLSYLLWSFVPDHAARLEQLDGQIPRSTIYALLAANWFVRLLPLLIMLCFPAGGLAVALLAIAAAQGVLRRVLRTTAVVALIVGLGETAACGFIMYAVHAAYSTARPEPLSPK